MKPSLGRIVHYRADVPEDSYFERTRAANVTKVVGDAAVVVNLTVFVGNGSTYAVNDVPLWHGDAASSPSGHWFWPPRVDE